MNLHKREEVVSPVQCFAHHSKWFSSLRELEYDHHQKQIGELKAEVARLERKAALLTVFVERLRAQQSLAKASRSFFVAGNSGVTTHES